MPRRHGGREGWAIVSLAEQLYAFGLTIVGGVIAGLAFDMFRVIRDGLGSRGVVVWLLDVLYWFVVAPLVAALLWRANYGELRFYVILGLGVGSLLYAALVSWHVVQLLTLLFHGFGRAGSWLAHLAVGIVLSPYVAVRRAGFALRRRRGAGPGVGRPWRLALAWRRR